MAIRGCWRILLLQVVLGATLARADHFDEHAADTVASVASSKLAKKVNEVTGNTLSSMPRALRGSTSALVIVKTSEGNWCKLLVRLARQRGKEQEKNSPTPLELVHLEKFVTYPQETRRAVLAQRQDIYLYDRFCIDLDNGQIVPANQGEDLRYTAGKEGGKLEAVAGSTLFLVAAPLVPPSPGSPKRKFSQGAVKVEDFAGKYRLEADGRWSGILTFTLAGNEELTGTYLSDQTGQTYTVTGKVGNPAHRATFKISFPMTEQEFEGYLWSRDRNRLSGITRMEGRVFGFHAQRSD